MDMALEVERIHQQQSKDHLGQWARQRPARGQGGTAADELLPQAFHLAGSASLGGAANPAARRPRSVDDGPRQEQLLGAGRDIAWPSTTQAGNRISMHGSAVPSRHSSTPPPTRLQDETHHGRPRRPLPGRPSATGMTSKQPTLSSTPRPMTRRAVTTSAPSFLPITALLNPHTGVKRRRNRLDVDGPNTAGLSSKKRRLRLDLVTSRLSRPYSEPASHVHCRYGSMRRVATTAVANRALGGGGGGQATGSTTSQQKKGGGASADASMGSSSTSTFLRYSIMNRMRKRLGLKGPGVLRVGKADAAMGGMGGAAQSSWHPEKTRSSSGSKAPAQGMSAGASPGPAPLRRPVTRRAELPHPGQYSRAPARSRTQQPPQQSSEPQRQLPPLKMSPRDRPGPSRSAAEPRRPPRKHLDEAGEDSFGFLHAEEGPADDGLAEEPDDVYCDFGMLFGRTAEGLSPEGADRLAERGLDPNDDLAWLLT